MDTANCLVNFAETETFGFGASQAMTTVLGVDQCNFCLQNINGQEPNDVCELSTVILPAGASEQYISALDCSTSMPSIDLTTSMSDLEARSNSGPSSATCPSAQRCTTSGFFLSGGELDTNTLTYSLDVAAPSGTTWTVTGPGCTSSYTYPNWILSCSGSQTRI